MPRCSGAIVAPISGLVFSSSHYYLPCSFIRLASRCVAAYVQAWSAISGFLLRTSREVGWAGRHALLLFRPLLRPATCHRSWATIHPVVMNIACLLDSHCPALGLARPDGGWSGQHAMDFIMMVSSSQFKVVDENRVPYLSFRYGLLLSAGVKILLCLNV